MTKHELCRLVGQNRLVRLWWRTVFLLVGAVLIAGLVAAVVWRIHSSRRPVDVATVYAADLAAAAIGITLLSGMRSWWRGGRRPGTLVGTPGEVTAAADRLADEMSHRWRQEAAARRIITPAPATVRWRWAASDSSAARGDVTTPGLQGIRPLHLPGAQKPGELLESGVVSRLHDEVYARLPHGRLVLIGESGAGKTGAIAVIVAIDDRDRAARRRGVRADTAGRRAPDVAGPPAKSRRSNQPVSVVQFGTPAFGARDNCG
jgi:hypothetical protein